MAKLFDLKIMTPERPFYNGMVEAVYLMLSDGSVTILADHMPMTAPVAICVVKIKGLEGTWRDAFASQGYIQVQRDGVLLFLQACEWPEEIDARRAEESRQRAIERLRQRQSMAEYQQSKISLARAMERLRVSRRG